jgi:hypothetical protein
MRKVVDADYEYVAGPMRVGDEHPSHPGWQYTGQRDRKGNLLWYKPPGAISRWIRRVAIGMWLALMVLGMISAFLFENPTPQ